MDTFLTNPMRVLLLEDSEFRVSWFKKHWSDMDHVETAAGAIDAIKTMDPDNPYTVLYLDHDLGGEEDVSAEEENTGSGFCRFLVDSDLDRSIFIVIHSMNLPRANEMECVLVSAGFRNVSRTPFHFLKARLPKKD